MTQVVNSALGHRRDFANCITTCYLRPYGGLTPHKETDDLAQLKSAQLRWIIRQHNLELTQARGKPVRQLSVNANH